MKASRKFALPLAALLLGLLLAPRAATAQGTDCPKEPTLTAIADGRVFTGINCTLNAIGDIDSFTFSASAGDTYQLALSMTGTANSNVCLELYGPGNTVIYPNTCTNSNFGTDASVVIEFTPIQAGTYMEFIQASGNTSTQTYTLEVSCVVGNCGITKAPPCTLKDALSYSSGTLTMNFTAGNTSATKWNAWLTYQNTLTSLFSVSQPITNPPVTVTKTTSLSPEGTVGVLSTLTTPTKGIICSVYTQVNTGTP